MNKELDNAFTDVLNAHPEMLEDVKGGLVQFCDKGFMTNEDLVKYCNEKNIPL